jgi:hypothetical protein
MASTVSGVHYKHIYLLEFFQHPIFFTSRLDFWIRRKPSGLVNQFQLALVKSSVSIQAKISLALWRHSCKPSKKTAPVWPELLGAETTKMYQKAPNIEPNLGKFFL